MSPVAHFFTGWVFANCFDLEQRDRALITLACVAPDVDGLGVIPELLTRNSSHPYVVVFSLSPLSSHLDVRAGHRGACVRAGRAEMENQLACPPEFPCASV